MLPSKGNRRGTTNRFLAPKSGGNAAPIGMPHQNNVTVAGDLVFSLSKVRKFFEFRRLEEGNGSINMPGAAR